MKYIKLLLLKSVLGEKHVNDHKDPVAGCTIQNTDFCLNGATCAAGPGFTDSGVGPNCTIRWIVCESLVKVEFVHAKRVMKEFGASKQNVTKPWLYQGKLTDVLMLTSLS